MSFLQPAGQVIDLGVNIDHVATVRNARGTVYPDPLRAALRVDHVLAARLHGQARGGAAGQVGGDPGFLK